MKRNLILLLGIIVFTFFPIVTHGAETGKIAVVDLQECIRKSIEGKKVFEKLKKTKDDMQKKLDKKQDELLKLKEELEKQGMMLSMDAKEDKEKEFERKRREFKYFYDDLNEEMRKEEAEARKEVLKDLEQVVMKIGEEGKYFLIFERRSSGLMYFDKPLDITDLVIKEFDKKGKK